MKFENAFTVPAPVDEVWTTLLDLERVAPCMPGAEVLEQTGENAYKVGIKVKVGPISMTYRGQVEITDRDEDAHQATMRVKAREARGQGTADATVRMGVSQFADGAQAKMDTDLQLSGRAASMGRGVIGDVAEKLIETFAGNLAEMLGRGGATVETPAVRETAAAAAEPAPAPGAEPATAPAPEPAPAAAAAEPASATAVAGGGNDAAAAAPPPPPPPPPPSSPPPPTQTSDSLDALDLAASVIAGRLKDPRTLLLTIFGLGFVFYRLGFARGKRR